MSKGFKIFSRIIMTLILLSIFPLFFAFMGIGDYGFEIGLLIGLVIDAFLGIALLVIKIDDLF